MHHSDLLKQDSHVQVRLLLVHGSLSAYRLSRLIKYSFYKNIIFGFLLFYYQFYNGFSGQALVDGISAAAYNVVFTSIPILLFAVLDRPVVSINPRAMRPNASRDPSLAVKLQTANLKSTCKNQHKTTSFSCSNGTRDLSEEGLLNPQKMYQQKLKLA